MPATRAAVVVIDVRGAVSAPYVGLVREDAPWREPLREVVLDERRSVEWDVPRGRYRVVAGASGTALWFGEAIDIADAAPARVTVELVPLVPVEGAVVTADGTPVPHARLGLVRAFVYDSSHALSELATSHLRKTVMIETGDDGRFAFPLHPEAVHLIYVEADGYAPRLLTGIKAQASEALASITLRLGAALQVRLDRSRPEGAPHDRLRLIPEGAVLPRDLAVALWTRPLGESVEWASLPAGRYRLVYDSARMSSDVVPHRIETIELQEGKRRTLTIAGPPVAVVDRTEGAPDATLFIPAATLKDLGPVAVRRWNAAAASAARFEAEETSGGVRLRVQHGCAPGWRHTVLTRDQIATTDSCDGRLDLKRRGTATVRITAPAGSAMPSHGFVRVRECQSSASLGEYPVTVHADRRAELTLPAGCGIPTLFLGTFAPVAFAQTRVTAGATHELPPARLEAGGTLLVRVVSSDGDPIDGAVIDVVARADVDSAAIRSPADIARITSATTRDGGWARLTGVSGDEVVLLSRGPNQRNPGVSEAYRVEAGQQLLIDPLVLTRPATLTVTIKEPDAAEIELVDVMLSGAKGNRWPGRWPIHVAPEGGQARFNDVPPGNWRVAVYGRLPGQLLAAVGSATVAVTAGFDESVSVPITRTSRTGRVLHRGLPMAGMLTLRGKTGSPVTTRTGRDGRFVALLEPGTYTVGFSQQPEEGPVRWISTPGLVVGDDDEIRIELPSAHIRGRVVGGDDSPIANVPVHATSLRVPQSAGELLTEAELKVVTDKAGAFVFDAVPEGEWILEASRSRQRSDRATISVTTDIDAEGIVLHLAGTESISGQLVDSRGNPLPNAEVIVQSFVGGREKVDFARTGLRGEFSVDVHPNVLGTPADIKIRAAGGAAASVRQLVSDPLLLVLPPTGHVELVFPEAQSRPPLFEVLVAADGSFLSMQFCRTTRVTRDEGAVLRINDLAVGQWRYVAAETPADVVAIIFGGAQALAPSAIFSVQPAATTRAQVRPPSEKGSR